LRKFGFGRLHTIAKQMLSFQFSQPIRPSLGLEKLWLDLLYRQLERRWDCVAFPPSDHPLLIIEQSKITRLTFKL